jgi:hypothetical protein
MKRCPIFSGISAVILTLGLSTPSVAQQKTAAGAVSSLLDSGWKLSPEAYTAAKIQYQQIKESEKADGRAAYAMALVALKNHQTADAASYLKQATAGSNPPVAALRAVAWNQLLRGDHKVAQSTMRQIADRMAADPSAADGPQTAQWLGRVLGFYDSPGSNQIQPEELSSLETDLKSKLPAPLAAELEAGKELSLKTYEQLLDQQATARRDAVERLTKKRDQDRKQNDAALAAVVEKLSKGEQRMGAGKESAENSGQMSDEDKMKELQRLAQDAQQQAASTRNLSRDKASTAQGMAGGGVGNPNNTLARRREAAAKIQQDMQQAAALAGAGGSQGTKGQMSKAELDRLRATQERLQAKADELSKPVSDTPPTVFDAKLNSVATYVELDLEQARKALLASYSARPVGQPAK